MASWDDVRSIALGLPGAVEDDNGRTRSWRVGGRAFAWERVLRRGERELLGDRAPPGPALGVRTTDTDVVEALVSARPRLFSTVAGYGVHPMVLVHVERASVEDLEEVLTDAWWCRAPRRLREELRGWGPGPADPYQPL
ncbi:MmcQ/YjbR family DNA-binding protein [Geodermatophilus sp. DSM 44513]|uniref:MmcQ/YjbR family DNA-binding protein n=1 Tax=Geodermatophilus sp. DSM 44513 TaxID=1528104 RepID=UPI0012889EFD|nr:MmcQ/YjbR family DNA-binding protein [Geodermatophilus sp. DSM 44513]WNV73890.1 MmcQ/YjbR family DNA-binding protein [Geodermatophilus sp. DSM 44513]